MIRLDHSNKILLNYIFSYTLAAILQVFQNKEIYNLKINFSVSKSKISYSSYSIKILKLLIFTNFLLRPFHHKTALIGSAKVLKKKLRFVEFKFFFLIFFSNGLLVWTRLTVGQSLRRAHTILAD